jgi:ribosomal-protein-alanine N-acetyltransferase
MVASGRSRLSWFEGMDVPTIATRRLELVSMPPALLGALLGHRRADAARMLGAAIPAWWPDAEDLAFLRIRRDDLRDDPAARQWLARAVVRRGAEREMIGHAGFHGRPAPHPRSGLRVVELGYAIFPDHRGRGYAREAAHALIDWARTTQGIRAFRACVAPDNAASLAIVRRLGFAETGERWDERDGRELVFELESA